MLGTLFQRWQTNHDIWEPSSKYSFVLRHLVSVQSKTLSGGIQVLSISVVPDASISITYVMGELQFLGPINHAWPTCRQLCTAGQDYWPLCIYQYTSTFAQHNQHAIFYFFLLRMTWYNQKTFWLKNQKGYTWLKSTMSILILPLPLFFLTSIILKYHFLFFSIFIKT